MAYLARGCGFGMVLAYLWVDIGPTEEPRSIKMQTIETTSNFAPTQASPTVGVSTDDFTAVFSKVGESDGHWDNPMMIHGSELPVIRCLGNLYQLDFEMVRQMSASAGPIKTMINQLLRQRSTQDFVVTLPDSILVNDQLFDALIYLCERARHDKARVTIVTHNRVIKAAFLAAGNDLPLFVTNSLTDAMVKLHRKIPHVA
jgi:hypothetical protein